MRNMETPHAYYLIIVTVRYPHQNLIGIFLGQHMPAYGRGATRFMTTRTHTHTTPLRTTALARILFFYRNSWKKCTHTALPKTEDTFKNTQVFTRDKIYSLLTEET